MTGLNGLKRWDCIDRQFCHLMHSKAALENKFLSQLLCRIPGFFDEAVDLLPAWWCQVYWIYSTRQI